MMGPRETCERCQGDGAVGILVPVCCERPRRSGECCGNAVQGEDIEACSNCGGIGWTPTQGEALP